MMVKFPTPVRQAGGRLYFWRSQLEAYKRALAGLPAPEIDPSKPDVLIPAKDAAAEFGFGRRTLGRRVLASERSASDAA